MRSCASRREIRSFISWVHSVVTSRQPARRKRACDWRLEAYGLRLMAVRATLAHGRARADLRLETRGRGRGAGIRLVARPRGPERRDAARPPAIALRARPPARGP